MQLKARIEKLVKEYLSEPEKQKVHHIEISVPGYEGRFWIIDAFSLMAVAEASGFQLAIYFSVNQHSRKGRRIIQTIEVQDLFEGYQEGRGGRHVSYSKVTNNDSVSIAADIVSKINAIFPTLNSEDVKVYLIRLDNWTTIE
jgi:hypothetical protein